VGVQHRCKELLMPNCVCIHPAVLGRQKFTYGSPEVNLYRYRIEQVGPSICCLLSILPRPDLGFMSLHTMPLAYTTHSCIGACKKSRILSNVCHHYLSLGLLRTLPRLHGQAFSGCLSIADKSVRWVWGHFLCLGFFRLSLSTPHIVLIFLCGASVWTISWIYQQRTRLKAGKDPQDALSL